MKTIFFNILTIITLFGCTKASDPATGNIVTAASGLSADPAACVGNEDCSDGTLCDTSKKPSTCTLLAGSCTYDTQCGIGSYCLASVCVTGCKENGGCPIEQPCIAGKCVLKQGVCNDNHYCKFGEICNVSANTCGPHAEGATLCQYCRTRETVSDPVPCNGNPCLIDSSVRPLACSAEADCSKWDGAYCKSGYCTRRYCGTSTCDDQTDPCGFGFICFKKNIVTGIPCVPGEDSCQGGRKCSASGENVGVGYCSCLSDDDCNEPTSGNFTQKQCVNPGPNGYCTDGSSCAPMAGLLCSDMFGGQ